MSVEGDGKKLGRVFRERQKGLILHPPNLCNGGNYMTSESSFLPTK